MDNKMHTHYKPKNFSDLVAFGFTKLLRLFADLFFKKRYGHRAVILETGAAVPGMVAGMLNHLEKYSFNCKNRISTKLVTELT